MKWLIVRYSAIGDCVMAAHVPSRIRREQPDSIIHWAVETRCEDVIDTEILVQHRASLPRHLMRKKRWSPQTWRTQMVYYSRLRAERFDYGLDLQGHLKTAICLRLAAPKQSRSIQATDALSKMLNPVMAQLPQRIHCVEHALNCLAELVDFRADSTPIMPKLESERRTIRNQIEGKPKLVTIAVGAGQADKAWPIERWKAVAEQLQGQVQIAFLGGPESACPEVPGAIDWVGKLTLAETMAAIAESELLLSGDTGAGHIAAAYHTPVLSVFGPTDPAIFRPYSDLGIVLRNGRATENTSVDEVLSTAREALSQHAKAIPH